MDVTRSRDSLEKDEPWGIPKLVGTSNYYDWAIDVEMVLRGKNIWNIVNGTEQLAAQTSAAAKREFDVRADLALYIITRLIERGPRALIGKERDPAAIWTKLESKYEPRGRAHKLALRTLYINQLANPPPNMADHITELTIIVDRFAAVGVTMDEEDIALDLLASLPAPYKTLVTSLATQREDLNLEYTQDMILEEEARIARFEDRGDEGRLNTAFAAIDVGSSSSKTNNNNNNTTGSSNAKSCEWCGFHGHWAAECRQKKRDIQAMREARGLDAPSAAQPPKQHTATEVANAAMAANAALTGWAF